MRIGVLSVQGAVSEHITHLENCGVEALPVKDKNSLNRVKGLIIPGGESTTIGKLIDAFNLSESIKTRSAAGDLALFGTCAGMVLLARDISDGIINQPRLGLMNIRVKRNAFGRQRESFETDLNFDSLGHPYKGVFIRAPIIEEAGSEVEILGTLEEGIIAARQDNMLATSFHPELTDDLRIHQYFIEICQPI